MIVSIICILFALIGAFAGGIYLAKYLANEVEIIMVEWENRTMTERGLFDNITSRITLERTFNTSENLQEGFPKGFESVAETWTVQEDDSLSDFWANGVARTLGTSFAVGVVFGAVTCFIIYAMVRVHRRCASGYARLDESETGGKRASAANWTRGTWLLIGCAAAVIGSSITAAFLVVNQLIRIHTEGIL